MPVMSWRASTPLLRSFVATVAAASILTGCASLRGQGNYRTSVDWNDTSWCVPWSLKRVIKRVSREYGPVTVHSTHRWPMENKRKGGKPKSFHLKCRAVDFSVSTYNGDLTNYLKAQPEVG
ncbi:MAG: D-Ala-D-Ala carboxypeptidase family metallohydrolase, partial [Nitratireductor sp.]|nr:D-Ala-D-Ala carboxypeptidase family metallohydrolase [Nitratireductor sp.]